MNTAAYLPSNAVLLSLENSTFHLLQRIYKVQTVTGEPKTAFEIRLVVATSAARHSHYTEHLLEVAQRVYFGGEQAVARDDVEQTPSANSQNSSKIFLDLENLGINAAKEKFKKIAFTILNQWLSKEQNLKCGPKMTPIR